MRSLSSTVLVELEGGSRQTFQVGAHTGQVHALVNGAGDRRQLGGDGSAAGCGSGDSWRKSDLLLTGLRLEEGH